VQADSARHYERHVGFIGFQIPPEEQHYREVAIVRPHGVEIILKHGQHGAEELASGGGEADGSRAGI